MREIRISQTEVAALKAYKTDLKTMADRYGISIKEMRNVLVAFGFAKPVASTVDYVITPVFDMNIVKSTETDLVNIPEDDRPVAMEYSSEAGAMLVSSING